MITKPMLSRPSRQVVRLMLGAAAAVVLLLVGAPSPSPSGARASGARPSAAEAHAPDEVVVGYQRGATSTEESMRVLHLAPGQSMAGALARLRVQRSVAWAVPDYRARIAEAPEGGANPLGDDTAFDPTAPGSNLLPDNEGDGHRPGDWVHLQWNFVGRFGINAKEAWANVAADGAPGGRGVIVAVLDTGVAYANRGRFRRSPGFSKYTFVKGYDFVDHDPYPNDRNGHGTFVAGVIAEETNIRYGVTGLAFGARIMPVRVLNSAGEGEASTIAEGVYFAVKHHAQVINLSLEFSPGVTAADIPELIQALRYAHRHGVLVVAAAGNEGHTAIAYPAHAPDVVSVGATTERGCLADYSNDGAGLTLVAPGGGADADLPGDPNCLPEDPPGRDVFQVTYTGSSLTRFGLPPGYEGTSMATPHVAATAALIIASRVLGRHPTPAQITARLRATARKLGDPADARLYGAGLVDAGAATAPGGPGAVAR